MLVYLRDGSAQTIVCAATLRFLAHPVTVYWHRADQYQR